MTHTNNTADFKVVSTKEFKEDPVLNLYNKKRKTIYARKESSSPSFGDPFLYPDRVIEKIDALDRVDLNEEISINFLYDLASKGILLVNLEKYLDKLQRYGGVMSNEISSSIIVSLINGDNSIPEIQCVVARKNRRHPIIFVNDGMQRIAAILNFLSGSLQITGTKTAIDGYHFCDLPPFIRSIFCSRLVRVHVLHHAFETYRHNHFLTYNLFKTKMANGEILNAKYFSLEIAQKVHSLIDNENVKAVFAKSRNTKDNRFYAECELLYVLSSHCLVACEEKIKGTAKVDLVSSLLDLEWVQKLAASNAEDEEKVKYVKKLLNMMPAICEKMQRHFGKSFNKKVGSERSTTGGSIYPVGYEPYARKYSVCSGFTAILFSITIRLYDIIDRLPKECVQEIAMELDKFYGDESQFKKTYNTSVDENKVIGRHTKVFGDIVEPVLKKYGYEA